VEPLKVTFTFTSPVVRDSEFPLHLDALIAWCVSEEAQSVGSSNPWKDAENLEHVLEKAHAPDGQWVWKASVLSFTPRSERHLMNMIRKCDPLFYMKGYDSGLIEGRSRSGINSGSGQERAYQFLMPYQWMECAEAWCIGDQEELEDLLKLLPAVGKLSRNGFGAINKVVVEEDRDAERLWQRRVVPPGLEGQGIEYFPVKQCIRAPYWRKQNQVSALEPC